MQASQSPDRLPACVRGTAAPAARAKALREAVAASHDGMGRMAALPPPMQHPEGCPACARKKFKDWREWGNHVRGHYEDKDLDTAKEFLLFSADFWPWGVNYLPWDYEPTPDGKWQPVIQGDRIGIRFNSEQVCQRAVMDYMYGRGAIAEYEAACEAAVEQHYAQRSAA